MLKVPKSETWLTICLRSDVTCQDSCLVCFTAHCLMQLGWNVVCFTAEVLCLGTCALLNKMETRKQARWNSQTFCWLNRFLQTMKVLLHYFYVSAHKYVAIMGAAATQRVPSYWVVLVHMIECFLAMARPGLYLRAMMTVNRLRSG